MSQVFDSANFIQCHMDFLIFFLLMLCGDIELNPGPRPAPKNVRVLYSNINGLMRNINELTVVSNNYDIMLCSETRSSLRRCDSELLIPGFQRPQRILNDNSRHRQGMALYIRAGFPAYRMNRYECGCHEVMVVRVCSKLHNVYIFSAYRNPSSNDAIFDCLLLKMATIQEVDSRAAFMFVGDFNAHHTEWLGSVSPTDLHGRAAMDFENLSGCTQLVTGPTFRSGNCLDLLYTDIPDVVRVSVMAPIGFSDHSSIVAKINLNQRVPSSNYKQKVILKNRVNWDVVRSDVAKITSGQILSQPDPADSLNMKLLSIINRRVPSRNIIFRSNDKPWFNHDCRIARMRKQELYHRWRQNRTQNNWDDYVDARAEAQHTYEIAETTAIIRAKETLSGADNPHKWWSTLKSTLFGSSSSVPPLESAGGSLVCDAKAKADLLMSTFDSKQNQEQLVEEDVAEPLQDDSGPSLTSFAFRSREVESILCGLDAHGGVDPLGIFPLFLIETRSILSPKLSALFRFLLRSGSFPISWRIANITPIPKGPSSSTPTNYRPISITPLISRVYERLLAKRLSGYLEANHLLPDCQFAFRKGLGTTDALLTITHHIQVALDRGQEVRLAQIDFSAAFDMVIHSGLLKKLKRIGMRGPIFSVLKQFLTSRKHRVKIDGSYSDWFDVRSGVPQGSVLGPLLFIIFTSDLFLGLKGKFFCYADDATLMKVIESPAQRQSVCEDLNEDLSKISAWCRRWGMKINPAKSKSLIISRSRTSLPEHGNLVLQGDTVSDCNDLDILGVRLDKALSFESHIRNLVSTASQRLGLIRKSFRVFEDNSVSASCLRAFVLPLLEYCAPVWSSAAATHVALVDKVFQSANTLCGGGVLCNLSHRRDVSKLCMFFKILSNTHHPLLNCVVENNALKIRNPSRITRQSVSFHPLSFVEHPFRTEQFRRSFWNSSLSLWNKLDFATCNAQSIDSFKKRVNLSLIND